VILNGKEGIMSSANITGNSIAAVGPSSAASATEMTFGSAISSGFANYANFKGRARRAEYWYWALFGTLLNIPALTLDPAIGFPSTSFVVTLVLFLPGLAVHVRRLHDINLSGWWLLAVYALASLPLPFLFLLSDPGQGAASPLIAALIVSACFAVLIYWNCAKGTDGPNRYGADPLAPTP
jgi:uncharacterized membrane protein YhaH (DUF805 family)